MTATEILTWLATDGWLNAKVLGGAITALALTFAANAWAWEGTNSRKW